MNTIVGTSIQSKFSHLCYSMRCMDSVYSAIGIHRDVYKLYIYIYKINIYKVLSGIYRDLIGLVCYTLIYCMLLIYSIAIYSIWPHDSF